MPEEGTGRALALARQWPQTWADDELRLLWEFLTFLRVTVVNKIADLDATLAAACPLPTSPVMSLLGVVKHLTAVERFWLSIVGGGADLPTLWDDDDADAEWRVGDHDTPASVVAAYQAEWRLAESALAGMAAGDATRLGGVGGKERTIRWVLTHLIQETAGHVGHMDLLRELADGARGE